MWIRHVVFFWGVSDQTAPYVNHVCLLIAAFDMNHLAYAVQGVMFCSGDSKSFTTSLKGRSIML